MKLIGIFRGKQKNHNIQILSILYENGPLTAWEITGIIQTPRGGRVSLHATLNKRLRDLEKKGYLNKGGKKWCLRFKGIIASILAQKTPKPLSSKWADVADFFSKYSKEHFSELSDMTVQGFGVTFQPFKGIDKTVQTLRSFDNWVALSEFVKGLIQTGVVNFDVISNETLFTVILLEASRGASEEQFQDFMKEWNFDVSSLKSNDDREKIDE
jgi:hypothetical protein